MLTEALAELKAAQDAKAAFLLAAGQDEEVEGEEPAATETDIAGALTAAQGKVGAALEAVETARVDFYGDSAAADFAAATYTAASASVKAALVNDAQDALAKALADKQKALDTAQANIANGPSGLTSAIASYEAALAAKAQADKAETAAEAAYVGAAAEFDALGHTDENDDAVVADDVITTDPVTGKPKIADGITEADYPGVQALLNAANADFAAKASVVSAETALISTVRSVNLLDQSNDIKLAITAIRNGFDSERAPANDAGVTLTAINAELNVLKGEIEVAAGEQIRYDADGTANVVDDAGDPVASPPALE